MLKKTDNKEFAMKIFDKNRLLKSKNNDIVIFILQYFFIY